MTAITAMDYTTMETITIQMTEGIPGVGTIKVFNHLDVQLEIDSCVLMMNENAETYEAAVRFRNAATVKTVTIVGIRYHT